MTSIRRRVTDYPKRAVEVSCGCTLVFRVSPPVRGDTIICPGHGIVKVTRSAYVVKEDSSGREPLAQSQRSRP